MTLSKGDDMLLLDYARDEVGVPMRGLGYGRHLGREVTEAIAA